MQSSGELNNIPPRHEDDVVVANAVNMVGCLDDKTTAVNRQPTKLTWMKEKGRTYLHATHERENRKNEIIHTEKGEKDDRPLDLYV